MLRGLARVPFGVYGKIIQMKSFTEFKDKHPMVWKYTIKKLEDDPKVYALVEEYKGGDIDGAYVIVLDGGESRADLIHTLQLMVCDTFKDKEFELLQKMMTVRKEVRGK